MGADSGVGEFHMVTVRELIAELEMHSLSAEVYVEGCDGCETLAALPVNDAGYVLVRNAKFADHEADLIEAAMQHEELRREAIADEEQRLEQIGG